MGDGRAEGSSAKRGGQAAISLTLDTDGTGSIPGWVSSACFMVWPEKKKLNLEMAGEATASPVSQESSIACAYSYLFPFPTNERSTPWMKLELT